MSNRAETVLIQHEHVARRQSHRVYCVNGHVVGSLESKTRLGYDLTCRLKATVGWSFLYWSSVMRPGDQIDTNVNPSQLPPGTLSGIPSPQFKPVMTDFWAQGLSIGLDYRY